MENDWEQSHNIRRTEGPGIIGRFSRGVGDYLKAATGPGIDQLQLALSDVVKSDLPLEDPEHDKVQQRQIDEYLSSISQNRATSAPTQAGISTPLSVAMSGLGMASGLIAGAATGGNIAAGSVVGGAIPAALMLKIGKYEALRQIRDELKSKYTLTEKDWNNVKRHVDEQASKAGAFESGGEFLSDALGYAIFKAPIGSIGKPLSSLIGEQAATKILSNTLTKIGAKGSATVLSELSGETVTKMGRDAAMYEAEQKLPGTELAPEGYDPNTPVLSRAKTALADVGPATAIQTLAVGGARGAVNYGARRAVNYIGNRIQKKISDAETVDDAIDAFEDSVKPQPQPESRQEIPDLVLSPSGGLIQSRVPTFTLDEGGGVTGRDLPETPQMREKRLRVVPSRSPFPAGSREMYSRPTEPEKPQPDGRPESRQDISVTPSRSPFPAVSKNIDLARYRRTDVAGRGKNVGPLPVDQTTEPLGAPKKPSTAGAREESKQASETMNLRTAPQSSVDRGQGADEIRQGTRWQERLFDVPGAETTEDAWRESIGVPNRQATPEGSQSAQPEPIASQPPKPETQPDLTQTGAAQNDVISAPETITERREPDHQVQDDTTMAPNETPESKKPVTVRDLANMQNGEASAAVLSALKKGDTFKVGRNRTYTVTFVSKPKRENFKDPKTGEDRYWDKSVIRIKDDKGKTISSTLLTWDDGKASFIGVNSNNRHEQLSRDIEGDISLDLINENNQFHDKTDSYKLAEKTIAVYNAPRAKRTTLLAEQQASRGSQRQKSELQYTHALVGRSRTKSRIIDMTQRKDGKYSVTVDVNGKQRKYIADESQFVADSSTEQDTPVTDDATTKTEPTDKGIKRYSTRGADRTRKTITVEQVRRAVGKGMKVTQLDNGRFQVVGQAAVRPIEVEIVDHIPIDAKAFEKAYGRKPTDEEKRRGASGVYLDGKIQISVQGDQFTIDHEFTHALIEAGVISYADARAILRSAGVDTRKVKRSNIRDYEEQIAAHIEDVRMDRAKPRTLAGRVIQKVLDFIDGLVNLVHRTARGVARDIESGKMFDRQAMGNMELRGEMYDAPRTVSPQENARYLEAVETGDMETARKMVLDAAMKAGIPILDDSASQSYRVRRTAPPKKTVKAYKLFKTKASKKDRGEIFPLFVGAKTQIPKGLWLDAIAGQETKPSKTGKRKVKSGLGPLAYRPGWHAGDLPLATHIGAKDADGNIFARKDNEVWAEVEVAADKDYQEEANSNGMTKDGRFSAALADIKHMPENGMYRYKTNPNMTGNWIISGSMKVNRILTEAEVNNLLAKKKIDPMPWKSGPLVLKKLGLNSEMANNRFKILDAVTYDDTGRPIPLSRRFDAGTTDPRYSLRGAERTKQDTIGAIKATAKAYSDSKPRRGGVVDTLLSSPEWRGGVGKLVFDKRMAWNDHRQKLFHEADIRKSDPDRSLTKDLEALKNIGIGFIGRMATNELYDIQNAKHVSPLYKEVSRVINDMDVNEIKWSKYDKTNLDPEVISIVSDYRAAMDKLWEYQYNAIGDIVKAYADKGEPMPELYKDPVTKQPVTLKDIYEKMGTLKGSYAPRIWDDGDFEVWSEDKDGQVYLNKKTTRGAAYRLAEKLEREGRKNVSFRESEKFSEELWKDIAIGPAAKLLEASAGKIDVDPDVAGAFYRSLLEEAATAFKERAFRKHRIARTMRGGKVVKGYIEDPLSRYVIYASRTAGGIAKSNAALEMFKALNGEYLKFDRKGDVWVRGDIERPTSKADRESKRKVAYLRVGGLDPKKADDRREYDMLYKYIKEQLKNPDATDRLISIGKSIISMKYLTSPKSALVNTTAIVTNAPAAIRQYATGGKAGFSEVGKALSKSGRDAIVVMRGGTLKDKDKQAFIDRIKAETIDRPQFMRDAMGAIRSAHGTAWSKVMNGAMLPFSITERWNRLTTLLAGYEMAKKHNKGLSDTALQEMAIDANKKAHGIYDRATLPMWALGSNPAAKIGQMGYTYQKFAHNWLQMMFDMGYRKKDIKGVLWLAASPIVLGGATGSIVMTAVMPFVSAALKAVGDDRDPEKLVHDTIRRVIGGGGEQIFRYGLFGAGGMDLSGSFGFSLSAPQSLKDLTGPFGGVYDDITKAAEYMRSGQLWRAAERAVMPNLARNVSVAVRELDGAVTSNGRRVWDEHGRPYVPNGYETVIKMFGARSARRALIQSKKWEQTREYDRFTNMRSVIYDMLKANIVRPNPKTRREIFKRISEYNQFLIEKGLAGKIPFITRQAVKRQYKAMQKPTKKDKTWQVQ